MKYVSEIELQNAILSKAQIEFNGRSYHPPIKSYPVKKLHEATNSPAAKTRLIAETYHRIDTTDLEEYEIYVDKNDPAYKPDFVERVEHHTEPANNDEINLVFFEIDEPQELGSDEIRRYIELSKEYSDVVIMPIQQGLLDHYSNRDDENLDVDLPNDIYRSYMNGVTQFLEHIKYIEKPVMGILPMFEDSRKWNTHIEDFCIYGLDAICFDFDGTNPGNNTNLSDMMTGIRDRGKMQDILLYAINHQYTSTKLSDGYWTAEDFLLAFQGFDVIGESHFKPGGGGSSSTDQIRVYDPDFGAYKDFNLNQLWRVCQHSQFDYEDLVDNPSEATSSKRLICCELMNLEFNRLRAAIDSESASEYISSKRGISEEKGTELSHLAYFYGNQTQARLD